MPKAHISSLPTTALRKDLGLLCFEPEVVHPEYKMIVLLGVRCFCRFCLKCFSIGLGRLAASQYRRIQPGLEFGS